MPIGARRQSLDVLIELGHEVGVDHAGVDVVGEHIGAIQYRLRVGSAHLSEGASDDRGVSDLDDGVDLAIDDLGGVVDRVRVDHDGLSNLDALRREWQAHHENGEHGSRSETSAEGTNDDLLHGGYSLFRCVVLWWMTVRATEGYRK